MSKDLDISCLDSILLELDNNQNKPLSYPKFYENITNGVKGFNLSKNKTVTRIHFKHFILLYYLAAIGMKEVGKERVMNVIKVTKKKKKIKDTTYSRLITTLKRINYFLEQISKITIKKDNAQLLSNLDKKILQEIWYEVTLFKCLTKD